MAARNSPCPCGSGKKHKRCCAGSKLDLGPCSGELGACSERAINGLACSYCQTTLLHCKAHHGDVMQQMRGHVLRAHPEKVPGIVERLRRDDRRLVQLRTQMAAEPEAWRKLAEHLWPLD
jgi:hypothetical protein